ETMSPMDFLDFRDLLRSECGFQSSQLKVLEAKLRLKLLHRYGQEHYISQLRKEHIDVIEKAGSEECLLELVNAWLERMPLAPPFVKEERQSFWSDYRTRDENSLADAEKDNLKTFDEVLLEEV